jgi:hypothetical protein
MDRVLVDDDGTGRRTFDVDGFSLDDRELFRFKSRLWMEEKRGRGAVRFDSPRDGEGASPNMKNLMKAPINSTTDSWPTSRP